MVKIHQTFSDQPKLVSELIDYLYSGQDEKMLTTVKLARLLCEDKDKRQKIADLVTDFSCIGIKNHFTKVSVTDGKIR